MAHPYQQQAPNVGPPAGRLTGARFWGLGFIWFVPIAGAIAAPILLGVLASWNRNHPDPLIRENARIAANWVLTATLLAVLGAVLSIVNGTMHFIATGDMDPGREHSPLLLASNLLLWTSWLSHLVVSIVGVASARSRAVNPRIAIPFFARRR